MTSMNTKLENIVIENNSSFQIKLTDSYYTDNGYIFGNLLLIIKDKIIGETNSINIINATTILDLELSLIKSDSYTPKVSNEVFYSDKEYIVNEAFLPFTCNHDYNAVISLLLDKNVFFNTPFGGSTSFEMVSGFILQSENKEKLRFVWKNETDSEIHDEIIDYGEYYLTVIAFLVEIEKLIVKYKLTNSCKEILKELHLKYNL